MILKLSYLNSYKEYAGIIREVYMHSQSAREIAVIYEDLNEKLANIYSSATSNQKIKFMDRYPALNMADIFRTKRDVTKDGGTFGDRLAKNSISYHLLHLATHTYLVQNRSKFQGYDDVAYSLFLLSRGFKDGFTDSGIHYFSDNPEPEDNYHRWDVMDRLFRETQKTIYRNIFFEKLQTESVPDFLLVVILSDIHRTFLNDHTLGHREMQRADIYNQNLGTRAPLLKDARYTSMWYEFTLNEGFLLDGKTLNIHDNIALSDPCVSIQQLFSVLGNQGWLSNFTSNLHVTDALIYSPYAFSKIKSDDKIMLAYRNPSSVDDVAMLLKTFLLIGPDEFKQYINDLSTEYDAKYILNGLLFILDGLIEEACKATKQYEASGNENGDKVSFFASLKIG